MFSKKTTIIIAGFILALALGTHLGLRWYGSNAVEEKRDASNDGSVRVIDDNAVDAASENGVEYTESGFAPKEIGIAIDRGLGCAIVLYNQSGRTLLLGLSPHKLPKDPGPEYPPIAPKERFLFDPRFTGFTELSFHDHERPELQFLVKFEPSCR
ncbi:MAG: hypothetical protein UY71_C0004G0014 [Parcubacteria group bacterium GW2011_GWB1_52_7]|nr:MAG: hypothetical protein UY64_C0030G0007 [Parcubacteria group bacterium GW2011_GWA1_51_12]KKW29081.1 MAG: hypothetical protein UY71_C0004G0014 [Parcubacteria group bacterium GW2011_GWB1_52_7]KKW30534.1 MAG: hypothetical protein UY75_C0030G0007 [Parcubacteria group bacterium GW2011_GWC2_52_8c]